MEIKTTAAQDAALRFLAQPNLAHSINGVPAAQIKIRTARPLIAAGLVITSSPDLDADAKLGGWAICALTDKGRAR